MGFPELHVKSDELENEYGRVVQWLSVTQKYASIELDKVNPEMADRLYKVMNFGIEYIGELYGKLYDGS